MKKNKSVIYKFVFYEGDRKTVEYHDNIEYCESQLKDWQEQGFSTGDDVIHEIEFQNEHELCEKLNTLEEK